MVVVFLVSKVACSFLKFSSVLSKVFFSVSNFFKAFLASFSLSSEMPLWWSKTFWARLVKKPNDLVILAMFSSVDEVSLAMRLNCLSKFSTFCCLISLVIF